MDRLQAMRMFRAVVQARSFSAAADELGTTHSTASRQIKELEVALRVQLLNRNTRGFTLTSAGTEYYQTCVDVLDRIADVEHSLSQQQDHADISGKLRLSLPLVVGELELADWLPTFAQRYPQIELDLQCTDRTVDMVAEGIDAALRISAALPDSSLVARKLAESPMVLVASPAYVAQHGPVVNAEQLQAQRLIVYSTDRKPVSWQLHGGAAPDSRIATQRGLRTDTITSAYAAARAGLGVAAFTLHTVQSALASGQLVRVLPDVHLGTLNYFAIYPATRFLPPTVRAFLDYMAQHYRKALP